MPSNLTLLRSRMACIKSDCFQSSFATLSAWHVKTVHAFSFVTRGPVSIYRCPYILRALAYCIEYQCIAGLDRINVCCWNRVRSDVHSHVASDIVHLCKLQKQKESLYRAYFFHTDFPQMLPKANCGNGDSRVFHITF